MTVKLYPRQMQTEHTFRISHGHSPHHQDHLARISGLCRHQLVTSSTSLSLAPSSPGREWSNKLSALPGLRVCSCNSQQQWPVTTKDTPSCPRHIGSQFCKVSVTPLWARLRHSEPLYCDKQRGEFILRVDQTYSVTVSGAKPNSPDTPKLKQ